MKCVSISQTSVQLTAALFGNLMEHVWKGQIGDETDWTVRHGDHKTLSDVSIYSMSHHVMATLRERNVQLI
jgi:hypothetical protein